MTTTVAVPVTEQWSGEFIYPRIDRVVFGTGATEKYLEQNLKNLGIERALLVTTNSIHSASSLEQAVVDHAGGRIAGVFAEAKQNTPRSCVLAGAAAARDAGADALLVLGGSSAIDCAKGVAMVLADGEDFEALRITKDADGRVTVPALSDEKIPVVCIPTTLSGSEFTPTIGITNEEEGRKEIFRHRSVTPKSIFLDSQNTITTPARLWASTGVMLIHHAVERLYSTAHQPVIDTLSLAAIERLAAFLAESVREDALVERSEVLIALWMVQMGTGNVPVGIGHAICHQLGGKCGVPHGIGACVVLPAAMEYNGGAASAALGEVGRALGAATKRDDDAKATANGIEAVRKLVESLGLPTRLRDAGVEAEILPSLAAETMEEATILTNPRRVTNAQEIEKLLGSIW